MVVLSAVAAIALPELASDPSNGSQTELEVTRRMAPPADDRVRHRETGLERTPDHDRARLAQVDEREGHDRDAKTARDPEHQVALVRAPGFAEASEAVTRLLEQRERAVVEGRIRASQGAHEHVPAQVIRGDRLLRRQAVVGREQHGERLAREERLDPEIGVLADVVEEADVELTAA